MMKSWNQKNICIKQKNKLNEGQLLYKYLKEQEEKEKLKKLQEFKSRLPGKCKSCNIITIIDIEKEKVYCPYMINKDCILY